MAIGIDRSPFQHLYPFEPHFVSINGFDMHYVDEGRGEPVLMLHGNPTWSFFYRNLISALSPYFRTIAPDHLGCGLSQTPPASRYGYRLKDRVNDLAVLLERLQLNDPVNLVVHDWGGMIGMAYAVKHPQSIRRLIVLNSAAFPMPTGKRLPNRLAMIRNGRSLAALLVQGMNLFARGAVWMAAAKPLNRDVIAGLTAPYNSWQNRLATLKFVQDIPLSASDPSFSLVQETARQLDRLAHLPMLICWGERDFVFDGDYLREWRHRFPQADVFTFADAGHYVLEDVSGKIIPLIKTHLYGHQAQ